MLTFGIDCGLSGAVAVIDHNREVPALFDLPVMVRGAAKWLDAERLIERLRDARGGRPARAIVEQLSAFGGPGQKAGVSAMLSKGLTQGSLLATLQLAGMPFDFVSPSVWKAKMGLSMPGAKDIDRKRASLDRARQLFPQAELHLAKHHNRAEALLLAEYYQRFVWAGGKAA